MVSVLVSVIATMLVLGWRLDVNPTAVVARVTVERDGVKLGVDVGIIFSELVMTSVSTMLVLGDRNNEVSSKTVDEGSSGIVVVGKALVSG